MRKSYLEVKVVKVKKKRKLDRNPRGAGKSTKYWSNFSNEILEKLQINAKRELERRKVEKAYMEGKWPKGNWFNGENLDAIVFPCYCKYDSNKGINGSSSGQCVKGIGRIDKTYNSIDRHDEYQISYADRQSKDLSVICTLPSLKRLFEIYVPTILPVKLIIFEEGK